MSTLDNVEDVRYSKSQYNQYTTLAKQWAFNTSTQNGDTKILYDAQNDTWNRLVADNTRDEGYQVIEAIEDIPVNEDKIENLVFGDRYDRDNRKRTNLSGYIEEYRRQQTEHSQNYARTEAKRKVEGQPSRLYRQQQNSNAGANSSQSDEDSRYPLKQILKSAFF